MRWFFEFTFQGPGHFIGVCLFLGGCGNFILNAISRIRGGCTCDKDDKEQSDAQ